ncbi:MAG TPA: ABC transporter permease [Pyrinomonadaceae bacterium]|nr:ABC transporter permease [Pyrinomonadaceae bacterium]
MNSTTTTKAVHPLPAPISSDKLPEKPIATIESSGSWQALNLKNIWAYRELLYFLTWRDVKVRYKQTFLGVLWVVVQPLATMLIFSLFFGRLAGLNSRTGNVPYSIFAFAGLLPWTYFANAVTTSGNSLVSSSHLITKIYFPRMIIPAAAIAAGLVDFALSSVILVILMLGYHVEITWRLLLLLPLTALVTLLALGVGLLLSAINVKYRDIRHALPFLVQIWMFASPVIYPTTLVPKQWQWLIALNPMTGIIDGFRSALFGAREGVGRALLTSIIVTLVLLLVSAFAFRRMEKDFADII